MVVEQIPLTLVVDDAVMVGPTAVGLLGHNQTFVFVGTHGILTHGIAEDFGLLPDVRIGQVVPAVSLESKRTFSLTAGQVFKAVDAIHLKLTLAPLNFLLRSIIGEFLHVGLEFGTTSGSPEDVGISVGSLKHARVDTVDALDRLRFTDKRSHRAVGNGNTDAKAAHGSIRSRREIEIVFSILLDAVGCPHRIGVRSYPGHLVLGNNHTVVGPVSQIVGREYMVVLHAEPVLTLSFRRENIVRGIQVDPAVKHACRRVGGKLVTDNGVLCRGHRSNHGQNDS